MNLEYKELQHIVTKTSAKSLSYPVMKVFGGNIFSISVSIPFKDNDGNLLHPAKVQPMGFLSVAKKHDVSNEIKMKLNINDIYSIINEVYRLAKLPVLQKVSGVYKVKNENITPEELTEYKKHVKIYKETPDYTVNDTPIKEYIKTLKSPTITKKYNKTINWSDANSYNKVLDEIKELNVQKLSYGKMYIETFNQTYKKFTDSSKNKDNPGASKKTLTLKIEVDDKRSTTSETFEQKMLPDAVKGEILTHYNLKMIETKNRKNTMVPQYIPKHMMIAFADYAKELMKQVAADHILLNHIITPIYFGSLKTDK